MGGEFLGRDEMKLKAILLILLLPAVMVLLAACGGGGQTADTPTQLPIATPTPYPTYTPYPTLTPVPPTATPYSTYTPVIPTPTPYPTYTPIPTATPVPTATPTRTPMSTAMPAPTPTPEFQSGVGELLMTCPTEAEIGLFESKLDLDFNDTNVRPYACLEGVDPDGYNQRLTTYQALRVMRFLTFDEPLPWTDLSLYDWLTQAIPGMWFFEGQDFNGCCDAKDRLMIKVSAPTSLNTSIYSHFYWPPTGTGLMGLVALFVHEGRHAERFPHTCGFSDATLDELGSWGVQHYYYIWLADHTPLDALTAIEREGASWGATSALEQICEFN